MIMNPSSHPYYPQGLILENYAPNTRSANELIGAWLIALSAIVLSTFAWLAPKKLTLTERLISLWFITCESQLSSTYTSARLENSYRWLHPHHIRGCAHILQILDASATITERTHSLTGHFVLNHQALASLSDFISQEWKEYAKSDSRYLHSDHFIIAIETITAVSSFT